MKSIFLKITLSFVVLTGFYLIWHFNALELLTLENLKSSQDLLISKYEANPLYFISIYFVVYVVSVALSIPGAAILTLAAGAIFGLLVGTLIVSFASTVGATLAFLSARFLFRDLIKNKFPERLAAIDRGIDKEGPFYLFSLRLVPIFPFFIINLLMGLTSLKTWTFFFISQVGMLAGTIVYVNAGTQLGQVENVGDIFSFPIIASFTLMGVFPLVSRYLLNLIKSQKYAKKFKQPKEFDYNMVVIGGGSAGLSSSYIASAVKAKVALIEREKMGGDCLNTGCVPSKAIIRSAKSFYEIKNASKFGHSVKEVQSDFSKVMSGVHDVIKKIEPHDSIERYQGLGVDCFQGDAKIISPYEVEVNGKILRTKNIVIATGARPFVPPIEGLDKVRHFTSDTIWSLDELPEKFTILGGGPIGCELAQSFARLGSKVTIIEMNPKIMGREDEEVSDYINDVFENENVNVLTSHKALRVESKDGKNVVVCESEGKEVEVEFDEILVSLGRRARTQGFISDELDVELNPNGTIAVNEYLQTTRYPSIYACGDVAGPYQFTHTAGHQAWFVTVNALFSPLKSFKVEYRVIPWCTFTSPEVARVGLNETEAKDKGIDFEVTKYEINDLDRAIADRNDRGFVKIITKKGSDKILGVTIVGDHAGDIISEFVLAMKFNIGLNKILGTIHIYPTMAESNRFAAGAWKKKQTSEKVFNILRKYHNFRLRF